jgi:hypothetical protein
MPKKFDPLGEAAFSKAESAMKLDKVGNGSFSLDLHATMPSHKVGARVQSPAQHASVVRAGKASARKRAARAAFKGLK